MNKVYCYKCGWIGTFNQLGVLALDDLDDDGNEIKYWCCPECGSVEGISDCIAHEYVDYELEDLWETFGDIPIDDNDLIQQEFLGFPVGTNRMELWKWFYEHYTGGVAKLTGLI